MARYWQSTTFKGFYVEGRHHDRTIAEQLLEGLEGAKMSNEIMGAGFYVWLKKGSDPALRVKDIGDRTLVELISRERPAKAKKAAKPGTTSEDVEEMEEGMEPAEEEIVTVEGPEIPEEFPPPGELEELFARVDEVLAGLHTRVDTTPDELKTKLDLQLTKWERPKPMTIVVGGPVGAAGEVMAEAVGGKKGGGIGALVAMVFAVIVLGGAAFYMITQASDDPYYFYQPGTQFGREETALGFINADSGEFIVINVPDRHDTLWGLLPRFVREETDTVSTTSFQVKEIDELRVEKERRPSVILEPTGLEIATTATELDISALVWNRSEAWEEWFRSEINRAIVSGTLVRQEEALWLQSGDNLIEVILWDLLTDEELLRLRWAESEGKEVRLEVHFVESFRYGSERTRSSHKLFRSEIRLLLMP